MSGYAAVAVLLCCWAVAGLVFIIGYPIVAVGIFVGATVGFLVGMLS